MTSLRSHPAERTPVFISLLALVACFSFASCGSATQANRRTAAVPPPSDFRVIFGEGGGISGLWSGYTIGDHDSVFAWKGTGFGGEPVYAGSIPADSLAAMWSAIDGSHLLDSASTNVNANFVRTLLLRANGRQKKFSWTPGTDIPQIARTAETVLLRCSAMVKMTLPR